MADRIRLLPDSVANQIAAGEVIQQPSSVIKELVENAADAGATEINIVVQDAGRTLIQVTDNGIGMSPTDARMAFERHATSKIRQASDLFSLSTMGFRGEALPSICAISQIELFSSTSDKGETGTKLLIHGSEVISQEPFLCKKGTTIKVKNIFYNVPARRRFMKSDSVEMSNIIREFERLALVNNNIHFTLTFGETRKYDLRAAGFKQRITDLWRWNPELLPVEVDTDIVRITGYVSRPEHARRRNALQYLIANGRCMRHPYFRRGILSCFERLIAADTQPCFFIRFDVNPADIDVNIHPTKSEIKFEHEAEIYSLLTKAVHATLGKYQVVPSIDFTSDALDVQPLAPGQLPAPPATSADPGYNPFSLNSRGGTWHPTAVKQDWNKLYADFAQGARQSDNMAGTLPMNLPPSVLPEVSARQTDNDNNNIISGTSEIMATLSPLCLQLDNTYIIAPSREGLMIIDQHRASQAILYADYMKRSQSSTPTTSQNVLFGDELQLSERQTAVLEEALPHLMRLGISLQRHGDAWVITSLPHTLSDHEGRDIIVQTLESLQSESDEYGRRRTTPDELRHRVALALARSSSVKRGQPLKVAEMEHLLSDLLRLPNPNTGPDGKPVLHLLESSKINSFF